MSFLSIAFLAAVPLIAAPIVLHLFDRRRNVVIEWGAMQFLMEAATRKTRARRFQHWLVLLMRVLALAALVFALARPLAPGSWLTKQDRRETILVIDNSMSTLQKSGDGPVFSELITRAEEVLAGLESGSMVRVLLTAPYPAWAKPASRRVEPASRGELMDLLHQIRATQASSDLPSAVLKAVQSDLENELVVRRHIVLLTDGQRKDWRTDDSAAWLRVKQLLQVPKAPTTLDVIEAGKPSSQSGNLAVRMRSNRSVIGVNQTFSVVAEVHNYSATESKPCQVVWSAGTEPQTGSVLPALQPGETKDVVLNQAFGKPGVYSVSCRIAADDVLDADNSNSIVIEAVERVPVLLVEQSENLAEMQQDTFLLRAALGRIEGEDSNWQAVFEPRTVPPEQLESVDFTEFRAVVIPNLTTLSELAVERLTQFVRGGGGLWLALGPRTDLPAFNRLLFHEGSGLSPVALSRIVEEAKDDLERPTINPFLKSHPATAELADNERLDTADINITQHFRFQMPREPGIVSVLLDLTNGEPLVVENRLGSGRVIVQGLPLRYQWSDLAVSDAFVVMAHAWLGYLAEPRATRHNLLPGDPIALEVPGIQETHAVLTNPEGQDLPVAGEPTEEGVAFRISHTSLPGRYVLETGLAGSRIPFQVARDGAESDLAPLTLADRTFLQNTVGMKSGRIIADLPGSTHRTPIWPALLMLLIGLMAGELILSGIIARQRFGSEPIADATLPADDLAIASSGLRLGRMAGRMPAWEQVAVDGPDKRGNDQLQPHSVTEGEVVT